MWPKAIQTEVVSAVLERARPYRTASLRIFGIPESELAMTLREIGSEVDLSPLEITTCLRRAELEVEVRYREGADEAAQRLIDGIVARHERFVFSRDVTSLTDRRGGSKPASASNAVRATVGISFSG